MNPAVWHHRNPLIHTLQALSEGQLTVGFIGGSITDARPRHNWPEPVVSWLVDQFPHARIVVENAAIGATGSELAVFRAKRDLIDRGCQLVFIDYAVNDQGEPAEKRSRTREGLLRKLLADGKRDVVLAHTYMQDMYGAMLEGGVPDSIAGLEALADHYGTGSVWMGLHALEEVRKGRMRWEEWLPDGLHPTSRGSLSYGQSIIAYLETELLGDGRSGDAARSSSYGAAGQALPLPLNPAHWGEAGILPLAAAETEGPWTIRRWPYYEWIDQVLETAAVGAKLAFSFNGRGLSLGFDFGKTSAEFRYRFDGGEWVTASRERPDWCGDEGWFRSCFLGDDLAPGTHRFELEVIHGDRPECRGTNFRLALIGVVV
ncbi:SGNH/GDSL hydrolase family protein [Paenibacillus rhizovicinus]|uniref:SGNH/GDSL hydrolase family protein n=1 Tax=Paenibacillus rhizovicinus TaxID=2704463 RepID=A0A6C0NXM7_9BACL|nr:SGNH/GDSL hydrolase family protein [Paenibacillus rhizovicinus]QHW30980.1 SGNH/GDSL hydrolase family protein [Paenibacillus rhizovicinus]